jgi:glycolate oxidase iron-sulfur subunit
VAAGEGCCGALVHHLGKEELARAQARQVIDAWTSEIEAGGLDAIVITASGCGTTIKDYGFLFRTDAAYAEKAARVSALAKDITEFLVEIDLPPPVGEVGSLVVAYHSACSMQHGQKIVSLPSSLLARMGFSLRAPAEGHLCCGSAGTYNMLQPELSARLRDRKVANLEATGAKLIATGNIGCITQLAGATALPIVHTVELLDWATGGPRPAGLPRASAG